MANYALEAEVSQLKPILLMKPFALAHSIPGIALNPMPYPQMRKESAPKPATASKPTPAPEPAPVAGSSKGKEKAPDNPSTEQDADTTPKQVENKKQQQQPVQQQRQYYRHPQAQAYWTVPPAAGNDQLWCIRNEASG